MVLFQTLPLREPLNVLGAKLVSSWERKNYQVEDPMDESRVAIESSVIDSSFQVTMFNQGQGMPSLPDNSLQSFSNAVELGDLTGYCCFVNFGFGKKITQA